MLWTGWFSVNFMSFPVKDNLQNNFSSHKTHDFPSRVKWFLRISVLQDSASAAWLGVDLQVNSLPQSQAKPSLTPTQESYNLSIFLFAKQNRKEIELVVVWNLSDF